MSQILTILTKYIYLLCIGLKKATVLPSCCLKDAQLLFSCNADHVGLPDGVR